MENVGLLVKVLWSPGEAMFLISKTPRVLAPLVFLSVCALAVSVVTSVKVDTGELILRTIQRSPQLSRMPQEVQGQIIAQANSTGAKVRSYAAAVVFPTAVTLLIAGVFFGLFTIVGREGGFKGFFAVTAFAFIPTVFSQIVHLLTLFVVPSSSIMLDELGSLSPAVFLDRDAVSPVLFAAAGRVDVVTIWVLILLVIGYGFLVSKGVSAAVRSAVVVTPFLLYTGFRLAIAYLTGF